MLNEEMSAGTNAEQSTNDETRPPSSPTIGNTNVIGSQSPPAGMFDLLDRICDGLISFRAHGQELYKVKTTLELPNESYNRFLSEFKLMGISSVEITDIDYRGFKFTVKQVN